MWFARSVWRAGVGLSGAARWAGLTATNHRLAKAQGAPQWPASARMARIDINPYR